MWAWAEIEVEGEEAIADEAIGLEAGLEDVGVDGGAVDEGGGFGAGLEEGGIEDGLESWAEVGVGLERVEEVEGFGKKAIFAVLQELGLLGFEIGGHGTALSPQLEVVPELLLHQTPWVQNARLPRYKLESHTHTPRSYLPPLLHLLTWRFN